MFPKGAPVGETAMDATSACGDSHDLHSTETNRNNNNNMSMVQSETTVKEEPHSMSNGHSSNESSRLSPGAAGDVSYPNGEVKSDRLSESAEVPPSSDSHVKTESPDTVASSEAMHTLVDSVIKQECLSRLQPGETTVIIENGSGVSNGPCAMKPKVENADGNWGTDGRAPTNGDMVEVPPQTGKDDSGGQTGDSTASPILATSRIVVDKGTMKPTQTTIVVNGDKSSALGKQTIPTSRGDALTLQTVLEYLRKHNLQVST